MKILREKLTSRLSKWGAAVVIASSTACSRSQPRTATMFKTEYRMQVNVGPRTAWGQGAARFAELAYRKTGGRIRVKPYYNSELLRGAQLLAAQMVARGAVDCAFESTINISPVVPELNVFALPFALQTYDQLDVLEQGQTGKILFDRMRAKGLEPLAWGENGFREITNSRRPIHAPEDLRGLRVRVVGSPIFIEIFRALGADAINMNWGDAITAFQQGTVDGQENPVGIIVPFQVYEYHRHLTLWKYACDPLVLYWCRAQWEAFPQDIQEALRDAAREAADFQKALSRVGLDEGLSLQRLASVYSHQVEVADPLEFLREKGMQIVSLTPEEVARFKEVTRTVLEKWKNALGTEVLQAAETDLGLSL